MAGGYEERPRDFVCRRLKKSKAGNWLILRRLPQYGHSGGERRRQRTTD